MKHEIDLEIIAGQKFQNELEQTTFLFRFVCTVIIRKLRNRKTPNRMKLWLNSPMSMRHGGAVWTDPL